MGVFQCMADFLQVAARQQGGQQVGNIKGGQAVANIIIHPLDHKVRPSEGYGHWQPFEGKGNIGKIHGITLLIKFKMSAEILRIIFIAIFFHKKTSVLYNGKRKQVRQNSTQHKYKRSGNECKYPKGSEKHQEERTIVWTYLIMPNLLGKN